MDEVWEASGAGRQGQVQMSTSGGSVLSSETMHYGWQPDKNWSTDLSSLQAGGTVVVMDSCMSHRPSVER